MGFVRAMEHSITYVNEAKCYGNYGEADFIKKLCKEIPCCKIKWNIIVSTLEGNAEIDYLVLHNQKLFAIEVKSCKGHLTERDGFSY